MTNEIRWFEFHLFFYLGIVITNYHKQTKKNSSSIRKNNFESTPKGEHSKICAQPLRGGLRHSSIPNLLGIFLFQRTIGKVSLSYNFKGNGLWGETLWKESNYCLSFPSKFPSNSRNPQQLRPIGHLHGNHRSKWSICTGLESPSEPLRRLKPPCGKNLFSYKKSTNSSQKKRKMDEHKSELNKLKI